MSSSDDHDSSQSPHGMGSEPNPLGAGPLGAGPLGAGPLGAGHWREVKPEDLVRRHVSGNTSTPAEHHEGKTVEQPDAKPAVQESPSAPISAMPISAMPISAMPPSIQPSPVTATPTGAAPPKVVRLERRQELEHHLKGSPTDLDGFMELGRIYRAEDRPADARRVFQQALQVFPDEKQLLWEYEEAVLARSLQQLREVTDVAKRLDTAESDRELKRCQNDWACRRMDVCRARLTRDPSLTHLRVVLAEAMHDAGLYEGAIEELRSVLDQDEFSPTAYLIQGRCLLEMGKDVEAMASLRAASLRRSVVSPVRIRVIALRLLCETAERLGVTLTLAQYRQQLEKAEQELAEETQRGSGRAPQVATANESDA